MISYHFGSMKTLNGTVVGAAVHHFKGVRILGQMEFPERHVLCFGLQHVLKASYLYLDQENPNTGVGGLSYVPKWLEELARTSGQTAMTAILLEFPPLSPEVLELDAVLETINLQADPILAHTIKRLHPLFKAGGLARQNGWVLDGIDLRYRYVYQDGKLVKGSDDYRHNVHKDLPDDMPQCAFDPQALRRFFTYLTGMSNDKSRFDTFVNFFCSAAQNQQRQMKESIFAQAAAQCRSIYTELDEGVKLSIIEHLVSEATAAVKKATEDYNENSKPIEHAQYGQLQYADLYGKTPETEYTEAVLKYAVGEQMVNLAMLGYIFTPAEALRNVVVVIGHDHVKVVRRFFETYRSIVTCASVWPKKDQVDSKVGGGRITVQRTGKEASVEEGVYRTTIDSAVVLS
jgi:hypothetical protein